MKKYTTVNLIVDLLLTLLTGGLWLVWIVIRFLRSNTK